MAHEIVVPRLGWSMDEGTFVAWLKRDGEFVRVGEPLYELEGEKASQEIESVDAGILRIPPNAPQPGDAVKVGAAIGFLVAEGEPLPWLSGPKEPPVAATAAQAPPTPERSFSDSARSATGSCAKVIATPRARRVARELGVDWTKLVGSGAGGRIREQDVRGATPQAGRREKISPKRRVIAERLSASRQQTVPVTLHTSADATNLVNLRTQFQTVGGAGRPPSYLDILTKLVAAILDRHPLLAGRWEGDAIALPEKDGIHIGIAVDTDDGLLVPVISDVLHRSLSEVAALSRSLIEEARTGTLTAAQMQGAVFTITNLGSFGVEHFTPVINLPECAILGVGTIRREAVVLDAGQIVAQDRIRLSLTFDHRVVDGAPAARFLQDLCGAIANPSAWLLG
jgi:pyruvate dehydrogenase E2 component (dihydrolipoamide acetyltransferase)